MGNKNCTARISINPKFIDGKLAAEAAQTQTFNLLKNFGNELIFNKSKYWGPTEIPALGGSILVSPFNEFSIKGMRIYVEDPQGKLYIVLLGEVTDATILYRRKTISQAINLTIEREIWANTVLEEFSGIKGSYIYEYCKAALLQGLYIAGELNLNQPLYGNHVPYLRIIRDYKYQYSVVLGFIDDLVITENQVGRPADTVIDGFELVTRDEYKKLKVTPITDINNSAKLIKFILNKIINREYDDSIPRIYEGIAIVRTKRAN